MPTQAEEAEARKAEIARQLEYYDQALALIDLKIFKIASKDGGLVDYEPKWEQRRLYRMIRRQIERGLPALVIILKARQVGFSTAIAILFLALALVRDTVSVVVAAHEEKSRNRIWKIYKTAWRNLPEQHRTYTPDGARKPKARARYDSRRELEFEDNETNIAVHVAGKGELGRSGATHYAHLSEYARWKNQKEDLNAVMESVPQQGPGSIAIIETTANGWGDHFHGMWNAAEKAEREGQPHPWIPMFMPWWKEPAYQTKPKGYSTHESHGKVIWENSDDENTLQGDIKRKYDTQLSKSQLQWRRDKIAGGAGGDVRLFDQENPSTPEHAFQGSGEHVFEPDALDWQVKKYVTEPLGTFEIELASNKLPFMRPEKLVLDEKECPVKGRFRLYRYPEQRDCMLMADPTHGVSEQSDPAALHVFDVNTLEQLAVWEGRLDQHSFGDVCYAIQRYYNNAFAVVETNIGLTTVKRMIELGSGAIYWHVPVGKHHADPTWQPGYVTTQKSRDEAIRVLKRLVRERIPVLYDARTLKEMQAFKEVRTGTKFKASAPKDKADNLVMALAIGLHVGNGKYGWTQNGKLMQQRKYDPPAPMARAMPVGETAQQAAARLERARKQAALRRMFDTR